MNISTLKSFLPAKALAMVAIAALLLGSTGFTSLVSVAHADHDAGSPYEGEVIGKKNDSDLVTTESIRICHSTASDANPYTNPSVNISSFFSGGHDTDLDDIIPPFHYIDEKDGPILSFAGMQWSDPEARSIWENDCVVPPLDPEANLSITKVADNETPDEGQTVTYTIKVTNNGPDTATGVVVTDTIPASTTFDSATPDADTSDPYTWNVPDLDNGKDYTITVKVTVDADTGGSVITNTATVSSDNDPDSSNDSVDEEVTVNVPAALCEDTNANNIGQPLPCTYDNTPAPSCTFSAVSDTGTVVVEDNVFAVLTYVHKNWTSLSGADWVWRTATVTEPTTDQTYTFEETFTVTNPGTTTLTLATDNTYRVFVNNIERFNEPASQNFFNVVERDLTPYVVSGNNTLHIEVTNEAQVGGTYLSNPAGVLYKLEGEGESNCAITTDVDPTPPPPTDKGTLIIAKEVTQDSSTTTQFSFDPSWLGANFPLADGETKEFELEIGTSYSVTELAVNGWSIENIECSAVGNSTFSTTSNSATVDLVKDDTVTCTFTNDEDEVAPVTYFVEGYVWNDENENDEWDGEEQFFELEGQEPEQQEGEIELPVPSWTVEATNGTQTFSTTTDQNGYYFFNLPAGTWTITEILKEDYAQTFPNNNESHTVTVPSIAMGNESSSLFASLMSYLVPTAHAQAAPVFGPFNFGIVFVGPTVTTTSGGGGGGTPSPRCTLFDADVDGDEVTLSWETRNGRDLKIEVDGTEIYSTGVASEVDDGSFDTTFSGATEFELTVYRSTKNDTCTVSVGEDDEPAPATPTPQVLGEQVSLVPAGGAAAGAGGASSQALPSALTLLFLLSSLATLRVTRNG